LKREKKTGPDHCRQIDSQYQIGSSLAKLMKPSNIQ
jgi:hypothetical protein